MVTIEAAWQEFFQGMTMAFGGYAMLMSLFLAAAALLGVCQRKSAVPKQAAPTINPVRPIERNNLVAGRITGGY